MGELVLVERRGDGVAVVTLNNPKVNALSQALLADLHQAALGLTADPPGAVVVTGGERLFLIGTGTGLAPWLSVARDPETYSRFGHVYVVHTVRGVADLAYRDFFTGGIHDDPLIGEEARAQLTYYPTVTREAFDTPGRITDRITSGDFFRDLGLPEGFDPAKDRVMLCGSMAMIKEVGELLETYGLKEGSNAEPADYVLERAFVG